MAPTMADTPTWTEVKDRWNAEHNGDGAPGAPSYVLDETNLHLPCPPSARQMQAPTLARPPPHRQLTPAAARGRYTPRIVPGQVGDVRNRVIPEHVEQLPEDFYVSSTEKAFEGHPSSRNYGRTLSKPGTPVGSMRRFQDRRKDRFGPPEHYVRTGPTPIAPTVDGSQVEAHVQDPEGSCRPTGLGLSVIRKGSEPISRRNVWSGIFFETSTDAAYSGTAHQFKPQHTPRNFEAAADRAATPYGSMRLFQDLRKPRLTRGKPPTPRYTPRGTQSYARSSRVTPRTQLSQFQSPRPLIPAASRGNSHTATPRAQTARKMESAPARTRTFRAGCHVYPDATDNDQCATPERLPALATLMDTLGAADHGTNPF